MDLKQYEQRKFALAEIIRSAQAVDAQDSTLLGAARDLHVRLAEDRFNLLVVGRFSRGKSTLMNAILGGDYLPTGIVPLTSVITTVRYGSRKQAVLHFTDSGLNREIPLSRLAEYVTQRENPGNVKKVAFAELQFPIELLRRGLFFVDSPGLGSPIIENTQTTEHFLPQADAFVLVTSFESPLSDEEDRILHRIRSVNKKLYVIINKQDTVDEHERQETMQFVYEHLEHFNFDVKPLVFSMSARRALEAKQNQNSLQFDESGIRPFETELMRFLIEERAQSFLDNMYERTMNLLTERSRSLHHAESEDSYNALILRLRDKRKTILGVLDEAYSPAVIKVNIGTGSYPLQIDPKAGCRICSTILKNVFRFLSKYQYELTINPETQQDHASRGGFCQVHTWQYEGISSPQGVCEAYPKLVHRMAEELNNAAAQSEQGGGSIERPAGLLSTAKTCKVCQTREVAQRCGVEEVATAARMALEQNPHVPACCLPHLTLVINSLGTGEAGQKLLQAHARLFEKISEDLQRYALKHDALRRHLTSEEERRASLLALLLLAGHRNVSTPWVIESIL